MYLMVGTVAFENLHTFIPGFSANKKKRIKKNKKRETALFIQARKVPDTISPFQKMAYPKMKHPPLEHVAAPRTK